jgi:predicted CXXCH cytochrome family protein
MYDGGPAGRAGRAAAQAIRNGTTPGSASLLCLSCHDGSIAVNQYGNASQPLSSQGRGGDTISPQYRIGYQGYLVNHHPIGLDYVQVRTQDAEIRDPDAFNLTPVSKIRGHLFGNGASGTGAQTFLECASCHSVHNKGNSGERLLWRSNRDSELCLTCHDKGLYTSP